MKRFIGIVVTVLYCLAAQTSCFGDILFESGTLGLTGVAYAELANGNVPGTHVDRFVFPGVRFELTQPAITSQVGGHFVEEVAGTFFGGIVRLDDESDFPDSNNLTTPDVLGVTTLTFPNPSSEVFGNLSLSLNPGWYALFFGSGLLTTSGSGGALRNGMDIGDPAYIAFEPNLGWFNLEILQNPVEDHRFFVTGSFVPEPHTFGVIITFLFAGWSLRSKRNRMSSTKHVRFSVYERERHEKSTVVLESC